MKHCKKFLYLLEEPPRELGSSWVGRKSPESAPVGLRAGAVGPDRTDAPRHRIAGLVQGCCAVV